MESAAFRLLTLLMLLGFLSEAEGAPCPCGRDTNEPIARVATKSWRKSRTARRSVRERTRKDFQARVEATHERHGSDSDRLCRELWELAGRAYRKDLHGEAYDVVRGILRIDSDHAQAREALGYRRIGKKGSAQWLLPFESKRQKRGAVWDSERGWIPSKSRPKGSELVFDGRRWVDRARFDADHASWRSPHVVRTERFEIISSATHEETIAAANDLEAFYRHVFRTYIGFFAAHGGARVLFDEPLRKPLRVRLLRDRADYLDFVQHEMPGEKRRLLFQSGGFYSPKLHSSVFPTARRSTVLLHEITHQILAEVARSNHTAPTWLVEGAAVYMEGVDLDQDLSAAVERNRRLRSVRTTEKNLLAEILVLSREEFHGEKRSENYARAGLAVAFFMEGGDGRYREDLQEYMRLAYEGSPLTILDFVDRDLRKLEEEFQDFVRSR